MRLCAPAYRVIMGEDLFCCIIFMINSQGSNEKLFEFWLECVIFAD